jgi:hypothetical protein
MALRYALPEIQAFSYPFPSDAIQRWRQCAHDNGSFSHGMDPDFIIPFLDIDEAARDARLILKIVDGSCSEAIVVVPDRPGLFPGRCWKLFSHDHIDVCGFTSPQLEQSCDSILHLAAAGLAQDGVELLRLFLPKMQHLGPGQNRSFRTSVLHNSFFDLNESNPYQMPTKLRKNNGRLAKKLSVRYGALHLEVEPSNFRNTDLFLDIEASGWKGSASTAIKSSSCLHRAYLTVSRNRDALVRAHVFTLFAGGRAVASAFGLVHPEHVTLLKIGFRQEFAEFSPGSILIAEILEHAQNSGKSKMYLSTFPEWAKRWKPELVEKECKRVYAEGAMGSCAWLFDQALRVPARLARLASR